MVEGGAGRVVVVAPPGWEDRSRDLVVEHGIAAAVTVVAGGERRQDSVRRGLAVIPPTAEIILVHDAARAHTPPDLVRRVIEAVARGAEVVVPALGVVDTVRCLLPSPSGPQPSAVKTSGQPRPDDELRPGAPPVGPSSEPADRSRLVRVQTPQGFQAAILARAHAVSEDSQEFTDDATACEALGYRVSLVEGDELAFKITTPLDLAFSRAITDSRPAPEPVRLPRTGVGVDAHRLVAGRPMMLAGLHFTDETIGLEGHSDGDVAAHAACDALLSAAGLGDMGEQFGTADPQWAGASGVAFLTETARRVRAAGFSIVNLSVSVTGNRPRLSPRRREAEAVLGQAVGAPVTLAATTTDGLGFTGRGEGVAAIATAIIL